MLAVAAVFWVTVTAQQPAPAPAAGQAAGQGAGRGAGGGAGQRGGTPGIPGQNISGMHIYIRGGLKTHGEGQHDYPQFMADWSKLLTTKYGAVVDGSFHAAVNI
jgi:hypothetical protein